ncbi:phasin family protein [Tistlia consotensis]|uniref:Phasin family protein n=1 Tax=Tistlia consotensis USBA 355 TaxID=560819 RepID=A0A1Y6CAW6_9PROT|nr:phasin family protein [Tistlia consotensis]SMF46102.1 phasin family protein [Tistlia consotensis USBA 355]SNR78908.1 phasin family protein [Tistlia consotensis]
MTKTGNPFLDMDFTQFSDFKKWSEQFQVPGLDMQAMMEAQRKNLEAIGQANKIAVEGAQALAQRQMEILRSTMEEASKVMSDLAASGTPEERMAKQADVVREAFERAISNMRELAELGAKSNTEALDTINKRISESLDEIKGMISDLQSSAKKAKK